MLNIASWRAWFIALCLIIFDILVISAVINNPVDVSPSDHSSWDFRIAELRKLETANGVYDISRATHPSTRPHGTSDLLQSAPWLATYFPGNQAEYAAAAGFWRQMVVITPALSPASPTAKDASGQVL